MTARSKLSAEAEWTPAWISTSQSRVSKRDPMVKTPSMLWAVFSNTRSPLSKPTPCLAPIWIWPLERPCHAWYRKTGKIQSCQQFPEGPRSASDMSETELSKTSLALTNWYFPKLFELFTFSQCAQRHGALECQTAKGGFGDCRQVDGFEEAGASNSRRP